MCRRYIVGYAKSTQLMHFYFYSVRNLCKTGSELRFELAYRMFAILIKIFKTKQMHIVQRVQRFIEQALICSAQ